MDVIILRDSDAVAAEGAALVLEVLQHRANAVFGLASGRTPLAMYKRLIDDSRAAGLSFRDVMTFNLDEYLGLRPGDAHSYRAYMQRELFDHIDIDPNNTFLPECRAGMDPLDVGPAYEALIRSRGGIDLQILGIGRNGHIGFNEPTSSLQSRTRIKTLSRETILANKELFDDAATQPQLAITMGIATIMDAGHIVLLATGEDKADAVRQSVEGPVTAMCPASALQLHEKVTVLLDEEAASQLTLRDYYIWVAEQKRSLSASLKGH
ncbi:MAG: glucosamine-6-phosphate deaminase [Gammaproteobacteria bacterium]|nr:glucosamine-6-phosphate deaminase [Gammaproteobacteria bacterium]